MTNTRIFAGAAMTAGLVAAALTMGVGAAAANAPGEHTWCPGMSMHNPPGPGASSRWDMNVCHTWYYVGPGQGNVPYEHLDGTVSAEGSNVWDGPNPPPGSVRTVCGNDMFTGIPIPC